MRAASHSPNRAARGPPAIGSRPVQFGIAVSRKPAIAAPAKPNSISCRCQAKGAKTLGNVTAPPKVAIQKASAATAQNAAPKKNGRKPPRRKGIDAAMRTRRKASICAPR